MRFSILAGNRRFKEGDVADVAKGVNRDLSKQKLAVVLFQGNNRDTYVGGVSRLSQALMEPLIKKRHGTEIIDAPNQRNGVTDMSFIVYLAKD